MTVRRIIGVDLGISTPHSAVVSDAEMHEILTDMAMRALLA